MSKNMTAVDAEALKIIRSNLVTGEGRLYDHVATTFRWIMATLFAANGGAILALLSSDNPRISANPVAIRWFAAGLLFSILVGVLSALWGLRAGIRYAKLRSRIDVCLLNYTPDEQLVADFQAEKLNWKTFVPSYAAGSAFLCLILGVLSIASRL